MRKRASLMALVRKDTLAVPGAYDAIVARLIEKAGFRAVYVSGAGLSNSCGLPDAGLLKRETVLELSSFIINAVDIPAIVDADTGFGGPDEVRKTVGALESLGASAIQLEDQLWPKRCGHLEGKSLVSKGTFVKKIRAATQARRRKDFLVIARTDAVALEGIGGAIERARAYVEAGADIIFPEALGSRAGFREFSRAMKGVPLMANMTEFGKTPYLALKDFREMGYSIVIYPMTCFRIAMRSIEGALKELGERGTQRGLLEKMQTREALYRLLDYKV